MEDSSVKISKTMSCFRMVERRTTKKTSRDTWNILEEGYNTSTFAERCMQNK